MLFLSSLVRARSEKESENRGEKTERKRRLSKRKENPQKTDHMKIKYNRKPSITIVFNQSK